MYTMTEICANIDVLSAVCRKHGISHVEVDGMKLTFGPVPESKFLPLSSVPDLLPGDVSDPLTQADACRCGHEYYSHSPDAGCLEGCPLTRCVDAEKD